MKSPRTSARRRAARVTRCGFAMLLASALVACGGSESAGSGDADAAAPALATAKADGRGTSWLAAEQPGLDAQSPQVADVLDHGHVHRLTAGGVPGGGHAVVWSVVDGMAWTVWARAYGPDGASQGGKLLLMSSESAPGLSAYDLSALVRRDGRVLLAYVVSSEFDAPPGQRRYEVRTRDFGLDGASGGAEHVIESAVTTGAAPFYRGVLQATQMAQWNDGAHLVAWQVIAMVPHGGEHPVFHMRRVDAGGAPAPARYSVGPLFDPALRLTTLSDGSWLASSVLPVGNLSHFRASVVQFEARHPLNLPPGGTLPYQTFVLGLPRGDAVLFSGEFGSGPFDVASPYSQRYNPGGHPAGPRGLLPEMPSLGIALEDGTYVALFGSDSRRFDKQGRPVGTPFGAFGATGDALEGGGMVLAWSTGRYVMTQRFLDPAR